MKNSFVIKLVL